MSWIYESVLNLKLCVFFKVAVKYFNCFGRQTEADARAKLHEAIREAYLSSLAANSGIGPTFYGIIVFSKMSALRTEKLTIGLVS